MSLDWDGLSIFRVRGPIRYDLLGWLLAIDRGPEVCRVVLNNALMMSIDHLIQAALVRLASSMTTTYHPTIAHRDDWCWSLGLPSIGRGPLSVALKHAVVSFEMWVVVAAACRGYDAVSGVDSCRHVCDVHVVSLVTKLHWRRLLLVLILRH